MEYKLYKGDCLIEMDKIESRSVDLILADLPFGTTKAPWDVIIPFEKLWQQYNRIIKENGCILLFAQTPFDKILGCSNIKNLRYEWIWQKTQPTGHLNSKKMPMKAHENILVFYKKLPTYNPIKTTGHKRKVATAKHKRNSNTGELYGKCDNFRDYDSCERFPIDVIVFPSDKQKENFHSCQKPVALLEYLIKTYTNDGDLVVDNVMGSGSCGVAAVNTNRNFIGIELYEKQFQTAKNRIETSYNNVNNIKNIKN